MVFATAAQEYKGTSCIGVWCPFAAWQTQFLNMPPLLRITGYDHDVSAMETGQCHGVKHLKQRDQTAATECVAPSQTSQDPWGSI